MSDQPEPLWRAVLRELLLTLAREIAEHIPHVALRWARRRFGFDPLDDDKEQ